MNPKFTPEQQKKLSEAMKIISPFGNQAQRKKYGRNYNKEMQRRSKMRFDKVNNSINNSNKPH